MIRTFIAAALAFALASAMPAHAEGWSLVDEGAKFQQIKQRDSFVNIVTKGKLRRFGVTLEVRPDGEIDGSAFGRDISGRWKWQNGYFCRDLNWGSSELGTNCQEVQISGSTLRFTSDQGQGRFADLELRR
ncbi:MAG: dihydrodipicolinate reductase [Alphaproteobacteria bacterium]|nr:dihydrodipicolinate reductase [Alphaproteobacteria bacterium]NNF24383.1 dihydrodipicolinate reductase [Paracoccaceae bacterium]